MKISSENAVEELLDSVFVPEKLTEKQEEEARKELAKRRLERRASVNKTERLQLDLMKLKLQLDDYLINNTFNPEFTFGRVLEKYLQTINRKKKDFARDIQVHETYLSQILNNKRDPNQSLIIRLELHSNDMIKAHKWLRLVDMEKEFTITNDSSLREKEEKFVHEKLTISF